MTPELRSERARLAARAGVVKEKDWPTRMKRVRAGLEASFVREALAWAEEQGVELSDDELAEKVKQFKLLHYQRAGYARSVQAAKQRAAASSAATDDAASETPQDLSTEEGSR